MKIKVTLTLERELWLPFRANCITRGKSASSEIEAFVRDRLESQPGEEQPKRKKK
jgi:hypothetical protein